MKIFRRHCPLFALWITAFALLPVLAEPPPAPLELDLRQLRKMDTGVEQWEQVANHVRWDPSRTAAVLCDMWKIGRAHV